VLLFFRLLFGFDAKEIYMRDLERRSGFSIGAIQAELKKLLRVELLEKRKERRDSIKRH
jgi:hypothetical protein